MDSAVCTSRQTAPGPGDRPELPLSGPAIGTLLLTTDTRAPFSLLTEP